jgi:hypothetical protein
MNLLDNHQLRVTARQEGQDPLCTDPASAITELAMLAAMVGASLDNSGQLGEYERATLLLQLRFVYQALAALTGEPAALTGEPAPPIEEAP